jgi:ABC-type Fe3+-hydroxamate transport system substrate-binding protein
MGTDKKENFKRIAELRTNKILQDISLLGNLSNKSYYEYTNKQIEAIFNAIQKEIDENKEKLMKNKSSKKKFRL